MKVLLVLPRPLIPADSGGKIRSLNIFSRLVPRMEIHAISLANPVSEADGIAAMRQLFHSYTVIPWQETHKGSFAFAKELFFNHFSALPYSVQKYRLPELRHAAEELSKRHNFDLVFCDFLPPAAAMLGFSAKCRVVFEHNVEFMLRKRMWAAERHPLKKRVFASEWQKTWAIEKRICRSFDHVLTVSDEDSKVFREEFEIDHVSSVPTGVDTEFFSPQDIRQSRIGELVFVGSMDWYPNEDGMIWFLREVFPLIRAKFASARLTIVGKKPTARFRQFVPADGSVELTGRVEDVRPYTARAQVVLVPLRVGGGTRIKIPEAMAMGRPIVSTTLGAEGLSLMPGREILLEDDPQRFAAAVVDLIANPAKCLAIAQAARERAVREYGWGGVTDTVYKTLEHVVAHAQQRRNADSYVLSAVPSAPRDR